MDIQAATIVAMRILGLISVFKGLMISVNILVSFSVAPPDFEFLRCRLSRAFSCYCRHCGYTLQPTNCPFTDFWNHVEF